MSDSLRRNTVQIKRLMPRYKITIEYLGTDLAGWQRQPHALSAQELIETAINKFSNEEVTLHAAGRTDAGVHAIKQVAHFDLVKAPPAFAVMRGINHYLRPRLVAITACEVATEDFHARFSAKKRHYLYRISNREGEVVMDRGRVWHIYTPLNLEAMQEAAKYLVGNHDFTSFRATGCQSKSPVKTLDKLEITKVGDEIHFSLTATSFLHHMVRNIVGTLSLVGRGKWQPDDVKVALTGAKREAAGPTAPACGLYFVKVDY